MSYAAGGEVRNTRLRAEQERLIGLYADSDDIGECDDFLERIALIEVALLMYPDARPHRRPSHLSLG